MERFSELYIPSVEIAKKIKNKFLVTMNDEGAFCIENNTKIPTDFQVSGAILETSHTSGGDTPDLEKTMQVLKSCKKDQYVIINNKGFLTYNAKAIYYLSCYGVVYGKHLVEDLIKDLCSGFFRLSNGDNIGLAFENRAPVFISDNKRGHRKTLLGESIFWLARSVTVSQCRITALKGIIPFLVNQSNGLGAPSENIAYASAVCLNRKLTDEQSFVHMFLDSVEKVLKNKPTQMGIIALTSFVYVIDSLEIPITMRHRVAELKEAAIKKLIASFPSFLSYLKKRAVKPIETFKDFDTDTFNLFALIGYDTLCSLSPMGWYQNRIRECESLNKLFDSIKLNDAARAEIIQDIAKCVY